MFVVSNFVLALAKLVELVVYAYILIIIGRALISWVSPDPSNPIVRFLYRATEPVLRPIRRRLPSTMGLDLSPLVVLVALQFVEWFVVETLRDLAISLR
ncbi:MAG: YggT family protein [Candidatus Rokuibacteriota bacterium]